VTEVDQVFERKLRRPPMVQDDIRDTLDAAMSRNRNDGQRHGLRYRSSDDDEAFDTSVQKQMRVGLQEFFVVWTSHCQEEESMLPKVLFDPADNHRTVGTPNLSDDSDRESAFYAQGAGKKVRPVIQLASSIQNPVLGVLRNRRRRWGIVQDR